MLRLFSCLDKKSIQQLNQEDLTFSSAALTAPFALSVTSFALSTVSAAISLAASLAEPSWLRRQRNILVNCAVPVKARKKLTAARLSSQYTSAKEGQGEREKGRDIQHVLGGDDETPSSPYRAGCDESEVLRQGELFGGTRKVGNTRDDEGPLLYRISE